MQVETLWFGKTRLRYEKNTDKNMKKLAKLQASPIFIEKFKNMMKLNLNQLISGDKTGFDGIGDFDPNFLGISGTDG